MNNLFKLTDRSAIAKILTVLTPMALIGCDSDLRESSFIPACPAFTALDCSGESVCNPSANPAGCYFTVSLMTNVADDPGCTQLFTIDYSDATTFYEFTSPMVFQRTVNGMCKYAAYFTLPTLTNANLPPQVIGLTQTCFDKAGRTAQMPILFGPSCT